MKKTHESLYNLIANENRDESVVLAINLLENKEITIKELYENVLSASLYNIVCNDGDKECIWREHIRSAIVRTIMECTTPYIINEKKPNNGLKVIVVCPSEEYHEIGAKMVHDFFELAGYQSIFVGANTPLDEIVSSVHFVKPDYLALSVTNYYNLVKAKRIVEAVKNELPSITVLAGGQAMNYENALKAVSADIHLSTLDDILKFKGDVK
ncbi:MAG: cobalamin-dependent protein [Bacilli bacterium]|nr:cobalamin-dependent protein [Bacilli bacterium]